MNSPRSRKKIESVLQQKGLLNLILTTGSLFIIPCLGKRQAFGPKQVMAHHIEKFHLIY